MLSFKARHDVNDLFDPAVPLFLGVAPMLSCALTSYLEVMDRSDPLGVHCSDRQKFTGNPICAEVGVTIVLNTG